MILMQMLQPGCVRVPLRGRDKRSAIAELVGVLAESKLVSNKDAALEAILARETIRSTGIGCGVAIPHARCKAVRDSVMAIGVARQPIDFDSVDGKPVSIVALLISPPEQTRPHIQALAGFSRMMNNAILRDEMKKRKDANGVWDLLLESPQDTGK